MTTLATAPLRALTAVALCDGHDAAIVAVSRALRDHGFEVIYLGFNKSPGEIVRAAIEEDADVITRLRHEGASIPVVAGGGGTITPEDEQQLEGLGVARIYSPGMTLWDMAADVERVCHEHGRPEQKLADVLGGVREGNRLAMARALTLVEADHPGRDEALDHLLDNIAPATGRRPIVIGVTGNGGAGKSTLIDELLLRLTEPGTMRVGVVCCDPTTQQPKAPNRVGGALLGDRIRMLAATRPGVFIRSLATRDNPGGVSGSLSRAVKVLSLAPLDAIILESAGIGQADNPFRGLVDLSIYVMTSEFGSALQLEKTVMLQQADIVVLNKCDQPQATAAMKTVQARLRSEKRPVELMGVIAARHRDAGVDRLCDALRQRIDRR